MGLGVHGSLEWVTEEKQRIEVNWVQSIAGALAAVTSAVLLSTVGVAGTVIGAALGSIAVTLGSAVYSYYLRVTKERVGTVAQAATRIGQAHGRVREASREVAAGDPGAQDELSRADSDLQEARVLVDEEQSAKPDWREVLAGLPWKRIAVVAAALFVAAMALILAFELITGRAVSSYTGGSDSHQRSSIPGLGGGGGGNDPQPTGPGQGTSSTLPSDSGTTSTEPSSSPSVTTNETAVPPLTEAPSRSSSPSPSPTPSTAASSSRSSTSPTATPTP